VFVSFSLVNEKHQHNILRKSYHCFLFFEHFNFRNCKRIFRRRVSSQQNMKSILI